MAQTVKLKRSAVADAIPTIGQLDLGEVAINTYDGKMYIKKDDGTAAIVEVGGGATNLDALTDVAITTPATNDVLKYDGTTWVNSQVAAGGSVYYKDPVRVATVANGTLATAFANGQNVDGLTLTTGTRILIKNQSTTSENGIYVVNATGAPTRASDMDDNSEAQRGVAVYVQFGNANGGSNWQLVAGNADPIVIGTNSNLWLPVQGIAAYGMNSWTPSVASAANSIAIGNGNTVSGNYSIAIGQGNNWGNGTNSIAIGQSVASSGSSNTVSIGALNSVSSNCTAVGYNAEAFSGSFSTAYATSVGIATRANSNSIAIGNGAVASTRNSIAMGYGAAAPFECAFGISLGRFSTAGDILIGQAHLWVQTTNATSTELGVFGTNSQSAGTTTPTSRIILANDSTYLFDCDIVARNTTTDTQSKVWNVKFGIRRGTSAANTALIGTPTYTVFGQDTGTENWDITVTADTANGRPNISVTGEASKTIRWVANIRMTKVSG